MNIKLTALPLLVLCAGLAFISSSAEDAPVQSPQAVVAESATRVKELRKQRIATLKTLVDIADQLYKKANCTVDEVCEARRLAFEAELEAASNPTERVAICNSALDALKQNEQLAESMVQAARATRLSVLKIKALRLKAEILLEQAKAEAAVASP